MTEEQKLWAHLYSIILAGFIAQGGYSREISREAAKVETNMAWRAAKECGK